MEKATRKPILKTLFQMCLSGRASECRKGSCRLPKRFLYLKAENIYEKKRVHFDLTKKFEERLTVTKNTVGQFHKYKEDSHLFHRSKKIFKNYFFIQN